MSRSRYSAISSSCSRSSPRTYFVAPPQRVLLRTPEREPHGVGDLWLRSQRRRRLQHRGHPRAVVVDAGARRRAIQMRPDHHDVLGVAGFGLRHHVSRFRHHRLAVQYQPDRRVGAAHRRVGVAVDDAHRNGRVAGSNPKGTGRPGCRWCPACSPRAARRPPCRRRRSACRRSSSPCRRRRRSLPSPTPCRSRRRCSPRLSVGRSVMAVNPPGGVVISSEAWSTW